MVLNVIGNVHLRAYLIHYLTPIDNEVAQAEIQQFILSFRVVKNQNYFARHIIKIRRVNIICFRSKLRILCTYDDAFSQTRINFHT